MNKQFRIAGFVLVLSLVLGLGYWQQQGHAAGKLGNELKQVGNKLKQLFSSAGASKAFSPVPATAPAAPMATITVTSLGDGTANAANCPGANCRLRDAIAKAVDGDTIGFSVTGTITLNSGNLTISQNLTINGPGAAQLTISGNNTSRVFSITSVVSLSGITIANGKGPASGFITDNGAGINNFGTLTLANCTVSGNSANALNGGGISNEGTLTITNSTISDNTASSAGGGIANFGTLTLANSTLSGNSLTSGANVGGGLYNFDGTAILTNSTLSGNSSTFGGGIYMESGSMTMTNCTLSANSGGGIRIFSGTVNARNTIIAGNTPANVSGNLFTSQVNNLIGFNILGPLANNGGPTQTHALPYCSPAINAGADVTTLNGALGNAATTINLADATAFPGAVGFVVQIDSEQMIVTGKAGNQLTVTRGANSTIATAHSSGAGVNPAFDQRGAGFNRRFGGAMDIGAVEWQGEVPAPVVVVNNNDSGPGSLRDALATATACGTITFANGISLITLTSAELTINQHLTINGPGANLLTISGNGARRVFTVNTDRLVVLDGLTIANGADGGSNGGGINNFGLLTVSNSTLSGNSTSGGKGGGIYNSNSGTLTVRNSTLSGNSALHGAGIYDNSFGSSTLTNCTLSGNVASSSAGGISSNATGSKLTLINCTLSGNQAPFGGGIFIGNSTVITRNTLIAGNRASSSGPEVDGTISSQGYNLIGNNADATIIPMTGDQIGTAAAPINPLLSALANNGGPTQTRALLPGSPAINAGDNCVLTNTCASNNLGFNLTIDQRGAGFNRQVGSAVDIGAFESRGFTLAINSGNNQSTSVNTAFANPLSVMVSSAFGDPVDGGQVTFTPPGSGAAASITGNPATISGGLATSGTVTANGTGGGPYNVVASAIGAAASVSFSLTNILNAAPAFTPAAAISRQQGAPAGAAVTVGTVSDTQTAAGSLTVTQIAGGTATGITVTGITNTSGTISAVVTASCTANSGTVRFQVSDGSLTSTGDLTVNITANTAPTLNYAAASVSAGSSTTNSPSTATDNGSISSYAVQSQGLYTGTISVNASGVVSISNAAPVGMHTITIRATDNCGVTTDAMFTLTVNSTVTKTTITNAASLSSTPTVVGQAYAVNVSVTAGASTPTGTVTVSDGLQNCTITLPATGCNLTSTTAGAKTITATYNGDANFGTSSGTVSHTVNKANTTTAITNSGALGTATVVGQAYSVVASVSVTSPGAGTPTGTITISDGAATCTITLPATSCNLISTTPGAKTITATYNGDANFNGSTSSGVSHTINKANTTTTITNAAALSSTPSTGGQAVTINWSVAVSSPGAIGAALTGNVTVSDGTQSCTAAVSAGTCSITFNTAGTKTLTATYAGDTNYNGSASANATHTVNATPTTTTITNAASLSGTPTVAGQSYAVNVSVTAAVGTPTGTVTVSDGSETCTITLPAISCSLTSTSPGAPKTITATYSGDADFGASSGTASHTVNKANTTTAITNAAALGTATVVGQSYSVAASVSVTSPGAGTPGGTITVSDGAATCTITLPTASCSLTSTTAGAKTITATYNGDANFNGSASTGVSHTVNKANTTTTITNAAALSSTPSVVGVAAAINWSVTVNAPGAVGAALTGNVTVSDGTQSCTAAVGAGTCSITFTTSGTKTLTATYAGDANYQGSASANATHTVNAAATTTTITNASALGSTPTVVGQSYAVNVSVTTASGTPTGTVTVSDGSQTCTITLPATSCSLTSTSPGAKTITATYNGDADFGTSSATASHTVNKANTTISNVTDSPDPSVAGQSYIVGFTLNITAPGAGTPTGTVTIADGTGGTCTATLPATNCSLTSTTVGAKTLTITYNGDAGFNTSSATAGHAVNPASTTTTITADTPDPSVFGQGVTVSFTVAANSPGGGTPTGNVIVTVSGGAETCTGTVAAGQCTLALTALGNRTLTAAYAGDSNYNGGTSAGAPHTVNKADTTATIVSDNPDSSAVGQNVMVVFTVVATSPGAGTPSGNVVVTVSGGAETCTATVAAGSCTLALTTPGARTLTATYAGDANFNGSSATESHSVVAPPSIAKAFALASTPIGGTTTLTLTITNPASNTVALTGLGFTDTFPAGLVVATPLVMTNTCGGTLTNNSNGTLIAGAPGIKLTGGTVGASPGNTCIVTVNVTPTTTGPFNNVTGNVSSTNGGTGNTASATLLTNTAPTISSNTIAPQAGSNAASFTIGTAVDPDQPVNTLGITINGNPTTASSNGVTVSNLSINANGSVTANLSATCAATSATFNLVVTDNQNATGTGTLTVTVTLNTPPVLSYNPQTITAGTTPAILPAAGPNDNGTITSLLLQSVSPNNGGLTVIVNGATGQVQVTGATLIGNYNVVIGLADNCGATATATLTINVVCPAISLNPANLPGGAVNTAYNQTVSATPAGTAYSFAVSSGALPNGLTLNTSTGAITGSPTMGGTFNFRVTVTGFGGCTAFRDFQIPVTCPAVTLTPASLPTGTIGTAYSQTVSGSPAGTYSYAVSSGALPLGLSLNATSGAITGTPTQSGSFNFTIAASVAGGANSCSGSLNYTVTIGCPAITLAALGNATAGTSYTGSVAASPSGAYSYSMLTGGLPSGLTLNTATGALTGLPATPGTYGFTIKAQAANGCSGQQAYTLVVACPSISLSSLATPSLNTAYSQTVTATPAGGNYGYSVTSGALPTGLSLNPATGLISGTTTAAGAYNFSITATGFGNCTGSRAYTGTIAGNTCPTITLPDLPNGQPGQLYSNSVGATPSGTYSYAVTTGSLPSGLTLYGGFGLLFGFPAVAGTYSFTITATDGNNCTGSKSYSLVIGGAALQSPVFGDFDGDGKADLSVWRGQTGDWLTVNSKDGKPKTEAWGASAAPYNDVMTPGDYDGDGKMDLAIFRRSAGQWWIKGSQDGAVTSKLWGLGTDIPVPGDYDGDGKTDIAVWRGTESNWYILRSSDGQTQTVLWGSSNAPYNDVPVPADFDGDGKTDIAVFRRGNGTWYIRQSSDGQVVTKHWGLGSDVPVAADYDGDGKADIAVWRGADTNWYIIRSSDGQTQAVSWGASSLGDVPVPADYDGDGKADIAIWRASEGVWYVRRSSDQQVITKAQGQPGDTPVNAKMP